LWERPLALLRRFRPPLVFIALPALLLLLWIYLPLHPFRDPYSTVLLDHNGALLSASIAADGQWRFPPTDSVPAKFAAAIVAYEDRRFYHHPGVDLPALARALTRNVEAGHVVSGGSTISMQVIRLSRPDKPRALFEKAIEMALALRLDVRRSKAQILALYASHAPFGGNVVGLEAASWRYYGRPAADLSWGEAATLAVLPNCPGLVHPGRRRDELLAKRNRLLARLRDDGALDSLTCALARAEPLPGAPQPLPALAPHLLVRARNATGQALVRTTLDQALQQRANEVVRRHSRDLSGNEIHNAAAIILDVATGRALVYVGNVTDSAGLAHGGAVDIVTARRSTGSILKPFLYAAMLDAGELLPTQLVADVPIRLGGFAPQNYTKTNEGAVPAYRALARSLNVPSVHLLHDYGIDRFYNLLGRLGMSTLSRPAADYGLTLVLGGAEGTLWDITGMYAGLARCINRYSSDEKGSAFFAPTFVDAKPRAATESPLGAGACFLTLEALLEVNRPGEEAGWESFTSSHRVAWKTGTSYGFRDAWAVGVTPCHAVGVWVGNADGEGRPGLTGTTCAAPILFELLDLLPPCGWFDKPEMELVELDVCASSGYRPGQYCTATKKVIAPRAGMRTAACPWCRLVNCDSTLTWRVTSDCERVAAIRSIDWFVLPPAMEWYYRRSHADYRLLPPLRPDCMAGIESFGRAAMALIYPREGSAVYVPRELDGKLGRCVFEAAHRTPGTTIYWHLDDEYLGATRDIHQMALAPSPGKHVITLVDENGERLERPVTILATEQKRQERAGNAAAVRIGQADPCRAAVARGNVDWSCPQERVREVRP
jgi:penicillin-binding protein 1C